MAAAVLQRETGVCARRAGISAWQLSPSGPLQRCMGQSRMCVAWRWPKRSACPGERRRAEVLAEDTEDALHGERFPFASHAVPTVAREAVQLLGEECSDLAMAF